MRSTRLLFCGLVCLAVAFGGATSFAATSFIQEEEADNGLTRLVVDLLGDKDKDMRALGFDQVRTEVQGEAATRQFAGLLKTLPAEGQVGLLSALADRGDSAARSAVLDLFDATEDESVRVAAIKALGSLGETADSRLLVRLLAEGSEAEITAARDSLVRLSGESVPAAVVAEMQRAESAIRVALIQILATRRALDTIPDLLEASVGTDAKVRAAAMIALGQLAGPKHIAGMVQGVLAAEKGSEREAAEKAVMFACGGIDDPSQRAEPLLAALDELNPADRMIVLPTLGRVGGPASLQIVEEAIASPNLAMHEVGLRSLSKWPNTLVALRLVELVHVDEHPAHQLMALRALIRVAPLPGEWSTNQRLGLLKVAMAMCKRDTERVLALQRAPAIRSIDTLRFLLPYLDRPTYAPHACKGIVELAHHRDLREPNKAEFDRALDKVIRTTKDATLIDRANRYKNDQTWARPTAPEYSITEKPN